MATPSYTPYPAPTPWINQPSAYNYSASNQIKASGSPQGFVVNPYSGPKYASPSDVAIAGTNVAYKQKISSPAMIAGVSDVQQQTPQSQSSGGGGGSRVVTEKEALDLGLDINNLPSGYTRAQEGPSPEQMQADVDNAYSEAMGIYNSMMPTDAQRAQYEQEAMNPYNAQIPLLEQQRTSALNVNTQQRQDAAAQYESALASARRLFQELTQGVQQRFGGSNSAGEFAQNFYGREYQNQRGQQQNTYGQNVRDLGNKQQEIETGYQANLQKINYEKEAAKLQAQRLFQDKIDQINNMKGQLAQNKAALKLQALQELRNRSYQIEDSVRAFQQQIEGQRQQALTNIQQMQAQYQINQGQPVNLSSMPSWTAQRIGGGQTTQNPISGYLSYDLPANKRYDYSRGVYTGQ